MPTSHGLAYAGAAASFAVTLTHPADTVKVRMQLQSEAVRRGSTPRYSSTLDCFVQCGRIEGIRGLQRGLSTAIIREFSLNFVRVGLFEPGAIAAIAATDGKARCLALASEKSSALLHWTLLYSEPEP